MWIIYIFKTIFQKIWYFLWHWYVGGFGFVYRYFMFVMRSLDREWALFVTIRYLFKPLYQDYSFAGYFFGIGFRLGRAILGSIIYFIITVVFIFIYLVWCGIIPFLIFKILKS